MLEKNVLKSLLVNPKEGPKQHFIAQCPFCNKDGHFYIKHSNTSTKRNNVGLFDCKKCLVDGNIYKFLYKIGQSDLILQKSVDLKAALKKLDDAYEVEEEEEVDLNLPVVKMPTGFKRTYYDKYLSSRGFSKSDYDKFQVGRTKLKQRYAKYVLIGLEEEGLVRGFIGRCFSKDPDLKRYQNSIGTSFNKIVGGYDEITDETKTVIIVEGLFDKIRIDNLLDLHSSPEIKCVFTNGKKISKTQIIKLLNKGVENVILFYDNDAANTSKAFAFIFQKYFKTIRLAYLITDRDTADSTDEELLTALYNLDTPIQFFYTKLTRYKLK